MNLALVIVVAYMFSLLAVSWYSTKLQKKGGSASFLFADNALSWPLIGVMIAGLAVGGASTIGIAQNAYKSGLSSGWYCVAWACGALFVGIFLAKKIRMATFKTINEMFGRLFGEKFRTFSVIVQFGINLVIVSLQIVGGAAVLTALLPQYFNMKNGLLLSAVVFFLIAVIGGLWAASLSNIVNMIVIYVGIAVGVIYSINNFGGLAAINATLPAGISGDGSHWYSLVKGMGIFPILAWFVTMLLQGVPNAGIMQTVIASKTPGDAKKGVIFAAILMAPVGFMAAMFGIMAASKFPGLESSALALPSIVMTLPPLVGGLLLSGLWAADVSTATGLMVSLSTMGTRDIVVRHIKPDMTDKQQLTLSKVMIAACTVAAYIMATTVSGVLSALMAALTIFSPFAILMTGMFLFPKTVKKSSGWVTLIAGLITFVLAKYMMPSLAILGQPIYTVTIVSLVAYLIASLVDKNHAPVAELFEEQESAA